MRPPPDAPLEPPSGTTAERARASQIDCSALQLSTGLAPIRIPELGIDSFII